MTTPQFLTTTALAALFSDFADNEDIAVTRIRYGNGRELRIVERVPKLMLKAEILTAIEEGWQHGGDLEIYLPSRRKVLFGHHDGLYWLKERDMEKEEKKTNHPTSRKRFRNHTAFPKIRHQRGFLFPNVCFTCRKSFKKPDVATVDAYACPQCGDRLVTLSRKFAVPRQADLRQWRKVRLLVEHGLRFYSGLYHLRDGDGLPPAAYPRTLADARDFVRRYKERSR